MFSFALNSALVILLSVFVSGCAHSVERESASLNEMTCALPEVDAERLRTFSNIRLFLRERVFPDWPTNWPPMFVYNESCQFILNYEGNLPVGFSLSQKEFQLSGFVSDKVYSRRNVLTLPENEALPFLIPAQAFNYGSKGTEKWFVMGLYDVWKRDFHDTLNFYFGMLAHEMFHPVQFRLPVLQETMDRISKDQFTKFYKENSQFSKMVDEERKTLIDAVLSKKLDQKRAKIKLFLKQQSNRRNQFFVEDKKSWGIDEATVQNIEGTAEYMNFRVMTDLKSLPDNLKLAQIDPDYQSFSTSKNLRLKEAVDKVAVRPSYVQDLGVLMIIALEQVYPSWQQHVFKKPNAPELMLIEFANQK